MLKGFVRNYFMHARGRTHTASSVAMEYNPNTLPPRKIAEALFYLGKGQTQRAMKGSGQGKSPTGTPSMILNPQCTSELLGELVEILDSWIPPPKV